jgi:hypothetical protein
VSIRLNDTATRQVRDFVPLEAGKVGIYLCGLTVQSEPHVGHVRSGVNFDVLRRWLTARGYDVHFIRNITDIEDKVLAKSAEQGRPWYNLAYGMRIELDKAYDALNVAPPTYEPAASGHVALVDAEGAVVDRSRIGADVAGFTALVELIAEHGGGPEDTPVPIETDKNLAVVALAGAGFTVYPVNPRAVARYRERHGQAGGKSDARRRGPG